MRLSLFFFIAVFAIYAYFFQGSGFNQNAHFDTARALVERHTFKITPYVKRPTSPGFTGDIAKVGDRVYSSKPPGLPLVIAPFYALVYGIEHVIGIDPLQPTMIWANQYLCTIWGSALPGAILAWSLLRYFREGRLTGSSALLLASGFAFGSLMFPYGGMLVTQTLMAACLFVAWRLIDDKPTAARALLAGTLLGTALLAEISAAPLVPVYFFVVWLRQRRSALLLLLGPIAAVAMLVIYQKLVFGGALESSYSRVNTVYLDQGLFLSHFDVPDLRRLYWLSFHPVRGLLYCCPVLVIPLLSLLAPRQAGRQLQWLIPAAVIGNFVLFNLTFHAWTAGWGIGPRYLVPALPFMMVFATRGFRRFPAISVVLIVISVFSMVAVTAVRAQWPAKLFGVPYGDDGVAESIKRLTMGQIARDPTVSNVGLLLGLRGVWSLIPVALILIALAATIMRLRRDERRAALETDGRLLQPESQLTTRRSAPSHPN